MNANELVLEINALPIMHVLDQEYPIWSFLEEGMTYYLDVRCGVGKSGTYLLLKLNVEEMQMFLIIGRGYLDYLSEQVQACPYCYHSRNQPIEVQKRVGEALSRLFARHLHNVRETVCRLLLQFS